MQLRIPSECPPGCVPAYHPSPCLVSTLIPHLPFSYLTITVANDPLTPTILSHIPTLHLSICVPNCLPIIHLSICVPNCLPSTCPSVHPASCPSPTCPPTYLFSHPYILPSSSFPQLPNRTPNNPSGLLCHALGPC